MQCPYCKEEVDKEDGFCKSCGRPLKNGDTTYKKEMEYAILHRGGKWG
jgi:rRNA maturation endonuclease Nob1